METQIKILSDGRKEIDGLVESEVRLLAEKGKIQAIKEVRSRTDCGLADAKNIVDAFVEKHCTRHDREVRGFSTFYNLTDKTLFLTPLPERKVYLVWSTFRQNEAELVFTSLDEEKANSVSSRRNDTGLGYCWVTSTVLDKEGT